MLIARSLLFVPANSWRMMIRSLTEDCDAIVFDLEDAVPPTDKETARNLLNQFLKHVDKDLDKYIIVRVNDFTSNLIYDDLNYVVCDKIYAIVLPKCEDANDVKKLDAELTKLEREKGIPEKSIKIIPLIESAKGVENAYEIAKASDRNIGLAFGAGDYLRDIGLSYLELSREETELLYARSKIVNAAIACRLTQIDTPLLGLIIDIEGLEKECQISKRLGFKAKFAIHPTHIPVMN